MNYRHAYHAGNFADVLKHAVLALVIDYLKRKEAPFRVVDTHAGRGRYALTSEEAGKTGEWLSGIGRLLGPDAAPLPAEVAQVLAPYLEGRGSGKCTGIADDLPRQPPDRAEASCAPRTCWSPTSCIPRSAASWRPRSAAIVAQK